MVFGPRVGHGKPKGALDKKSSPGLSPICVFSRLCDLGQATPPLWVSTFLTRGKHLLAVLVDGANGRGP